MSLNMFVGWSISYMNLLFDLRLVILLILISKHILPNISKNISCNWYSSISSLSGHLNLFMPAFFHSLYLYSWILSYLLFALGKFSLHKGGHTTGQYESVVLFRDFNFLWLLFAASFDEGSSRFCFVASSRCTMILVF